MEQVELDLITDPESEAFDRAMAIYESSFPEDEREPRWHFERRLAEHGKREGRSVPFLWAIKADGEVIGMAYLAADRETETLFFVYVAVDRPHRGRYSAKLLIRRVVEESTKACQGLGISLAGVIFEVERIEDAVDERDARMRRHRLALFKSLGGRVLSDKYVQPSLQPDKRPVPLNLMFVPFRDGWSGQALIEGFYSWVFKLPADHPYVVQTLAGRTEN